MSQIKVEDNTDGIKAHRLAVDRCWIHCELVYALAPWLRHEVETLIQHESKSIRGKMPKTYKERPLGIDPDYYPMRHRV